MIRKTLTWVNRAVVIAKEFVMALRINGDCSGFDVSAEACLKREIGVADAPQCRLARPLDCIGDRSAYRDSHDQMLMKHQALQS